MADTLRHAYIPSQKIYRYLHHCLDNLHRLIHCTLGSMDIVGIEHSKTARLEQDIALRYQSFVEGNVFFLVIRLQNLQVGTEGAPAHILLPCGQVLDINVFLVGLRMAILRQFGHVPLQVHKAILALDKVLAILHLGEIMVAQILQGLGNSLGIDYMSLVKSVNTAKKYLSVLEEMGLLTKEKIGKEFVWFNTELMDILSD
jgi:hypothetical protein